jgi:asparagine synthetase B (glutamine-hydrolysing)
MQQTGVFESGGIDRSVLASVLRQHSDAAITTKSFVAMDMGVRHCLSGRNSLTRVLSTTCLA